MANELRGEASFDAGEKTYTLKFDIDALCQLETLLDMSVGKIFQRLSETAPRLSDVRAAIWAGLRAHHREVDIVQAGEIAAASGGAAFKALLKALGASFPAREGKAKRARPPKAAGTGSRS